MRFQSYNKILYGVRKNWIIFLVFKGVCLCKFDFVVFVFRFLKLKNIMMVQMKYGIENELVVVKIYSEIIGYSVYLCGFVINFSVLYLVYYLIGRCLI